MRKGGEVLGYLGSGKHRGRSVREEEAVIENKALKIISSNFRIFPTFFSFLLLFLFVFKYLGRRSTAYHEGDT